MLLWVVGVGFENTFPVSGQRNVSRVVPELCRWVYKIFKKPCVISLTVSFHHVGLPFSGFSISGYKCEFPNRAAPV